MSERPGATLTPPSPDALDPLRAAMRAAGLMPHDLRSAHEQPPAVRPA